MRNRELALGLYFSAVSLGLIAAVLNNPIEASTHVWLIVMGTATEIAGVLLIASPELGEVVQRTAAFVGRRSRIVGMVLARWLRRLLRLRKDVHIVAVAAGATASAMGGTGRVIQGPPPDVTREQLDRWVAEQLGALDDRINAVEASVRTMPEQWQLEIDTARRDVGELARSLVQGLAGRRLTLRLLGVAYVVIGLTLSMAGHLVA